MARYAPGSQRREVMEVKKREARRLLERELSVAQVSGQLHCSKPFVRGILAEMQTGAAPEGGRTEWSA